MNKWFVLALIATVAFGVQAGDGEGEKKGEGKDAEITKAQFVARQKTMAEKKGTEFDQTATEAKFDKLDKNGDGKLTGDEKPKRKGKKNGEGKNAEITKAQFVAQQKAMAEKKGMEFDQAAAEAKFNKLDKNKDGKLTGAEKPKKKGKKEKKVPAAEVSEAETSE